MEHHELMGGRVQLYQRPNSRFWQCSASVGRKQFRTSTKEESLARAKQVAQDWFLTLEGKNHAGTLISEKTFAEAADKFMAEYEVITEGQRSRKWVAGHEARLRLHLLPFFGKMGLSQITPGTVQDYRVHRIKSATQEEDVSPPTGYGKITGKRGSAKAAKGKATSDGHVPAAKSGGVVQSGKEKKRKPPARSTLHDEVVTLRLALKTAIRHGWLTNLIDVTPPYGAQGKIVHRPWFSPDEYKLLYETSREFVRNPPQEQYRWNAEKVHDFILFMGNTGLRPDEAKNLQHRDVTIVTDYATNDRILEIEVRGKRGVGYCKSMPGAVRPYERLLNRPKPTRGKQKRNRSRKNPNPSLPVELPEPTDLVFPGDHHELFNQILERAGLKFDRDGKPRTAYSLRHTYICLRLMEGADIYQIAKNCRTSVEMIEKHYAAHIKNTLDTAAINVVRPKAAKAAEKAAKKNGRQAAKSNGNTKPAEKAGPGGKLRDAVRVPAAHLSPGDLTSET